jgi:hypothetical protein
VFRTPFPAPHAECASRRDRSIVAWHEVPGMTPPKEPSRRARCDSRRCARRFDDWSDESFAYEPPGGPGQFRRETPCFLFSKYPQAPYPTLNRIQSYRCPVLYSQASHGPVLAGSESCSKPYTSGRMNIAASAPIRGKMATKRVAPAWPMAVNRAGNRKIARKDGTLTKT